MLFKKEKDMKKGVILFVMLCLALSANAQRWTLWYGVAISDETGHQSGFKNAECHFSNFGLDYTWMVPKWDLTLGVGLNTKGGQYITNYAQLEANAAYRFIDTDSGFSLSALAGPYFGVKVSDGAMYAKPYSVGWQVGIQMIVFNHISLKVGYERALTIPTKGSRHGFDDIPHTIFIRLGDVF